MAMSAFKRSVAADTKRRGGKGGKGSWYDRLKLPQSSPGTPFVVVKAEYIDPSPSADQIEVDPATGRPKPVINPYYKFKKHVRAIKAQNFFADEVCSSGHDPHNPQPCVGCLAIDVNDKSVRLSEMFAFTIVHLAYYHGHPLIDREKGGIVMKNDQSGPVMVYTECAGRTCNFCRVLGGQPPFPPQNQGDEPWPGYDPRSLTTVFGRRRYLEVGKGHLSDLEGIDQAISAECGNCRSQLTTDGFACPHCNALIIDMSNDPRSDEQIQADVMRPYPCMRCNRPVLLKEIVSCDTCASQNAQPLQLSLFDVVIYGMRQGEDAKSHIVKSSHKTIEEFSRGIDPRFFNGKTLREHIAELAKPYDFDQIFKPRDLQAQSQRLKLPMPSVGMPGMYPQQPQYAQAQQIQQPAQMYAPQQPMMAPQPQMAPQQMMAPQAPPLQPGPQMGQPYQPYQQVPAQPQQQQAGPPAFVPVLPPNYGRS